MSGGIKDKAIDILTQAAEADKNGDYQKAVRLYESGIECFLHAVKYEVHGEKAKAHIRGKIGEYLERAEKLKKSLKDKKGKKLVEGGGTSKSSKGSKSK